MAARYSRPSFNEIKKAAQGRCRALLQSAGFQVDQLDGKGRPCPKCGGEDRFEASKDVDNDGKVFCRSCFNKSSNPKPGDVIASVAWFRGESNGDAATWIANQLGMVGEKPVEIDIVEAVARDKRMPLDAFKLFGAESALRGKLRVARVPAYNDRGEPFSYFDIAPTTKGWFKRGDGQSGMFFPGCLPKPGETWCLVEGVKDAAALIGLGFNAAGLPSCFMADKYAKLFDDVDVICVGDLDKVGQSGAQRTGAVLSGIANSIRLARLPGEIVAKGGEDVRDVLRRPNGVELVREAIASGKTWEPSEGDDQKDGRPEVFLTLKEGLVADQVVKHVGKLGWETTWIPEGKREHIKVYARGGVLVQVIESEDPNNSGQLLIRPIPPPITRERIAEACQLMIEEINGDDIEIKPARPQKWLIDAVHCRGHYAGDIRPLVGVISSPTIRADGSILQAPGYDKTTALLYRPAIKFPLVPENPTKEQAKSAYDKLCEVVVDFPFLEPSDLAACISMYLSMIGRTCITGCVPLFAITANNRGAGKSLLSDVGSLLSSGRPSSRKAFTTDENELRKSITAIALEGIPSVLFDNLDCQLGGASLDAVLTAESWSDRVLGTSSTTGELPMKTIWSATGNNLAFGSDIARRVLPIRLQTALETPEDRTGFVHPDLLTWVRDNRPELATAALTILRAFFVAGCPVQDGGEWGSFESWSRIIRGALVWCGAPDPLPTRKTATENDDSKNLLAMLITGIEEVDPNREGVTVKTIERLTSHRVDETPVCPTLVEAVAEVCGSKFNSTVLGRKLRSFIGRTWDGKKLTSKSCRGGVKKWSVMFAGGGLGGLGGFATSDAWNPQTRSLFNTHDANIEHDPYRPCDGGTQPNHSNPPLNSEVEF